MEKLRVCFVCSYPPNRARLSEYSKYLLDELAKRPKIESICVLADTINGYKNTVLISPKVEVNRIWTSDDAFSIVALVPYILKMNPDLVHLNVHFQSFGRSRIVNFIGLSLVFLLSLFKIKVILTIHNLADKIDLTEVNVNPSLINKMGLILATKFILKADIITVTVKSYVIHLKKVHGYDRAVYIRHGSTINTGNTYKFVKDTEKNILFFGHMAPHKGLPILLDAFKELIRERNDVKLIIAGSDHPNFVGYLKTFRLNSIPNVEYLGYIPEKDIQDLFSLSTIVVLPYLTTTGTSGVFHLASGAGKPIIASELPEIKELIFDGASALFVKPGDSLELKEAIDFLLNNPELAQKMGEKNLKYAKNETWSNIAERFETEYLKLLRGNFNISIYK